MYVTLLLHVQVRYINNYDEKKKKTKHQTINNKNGAARTKLTISYFRRWIHLTRCWIVFLQKCLLAKSKAKRFNFRRFVTLPSDFSHCSWTVRVKIRRADRDEGAGVYERVKGRERSPAPSCRARLRDILCPVLGKTIANRINEHCLALQLW